MTSSRRRSGIELNRPFDDATDPTKAVLARGARPEVSDR